MNLLRNKGLLAILPVLMISTLAVATAHADTTDLFTLADHNNKQVITFDLFSSPTPSALNASCESGLSGEFCIDSVAVDINGKTTSNNVEFFDSSQDGGLAIDANGTKYDFILDQTGDQLFSGTVGSPTFLLGEYALTNVDSTYNKFDKDFSLDITASPIPEPPTLLLLGTGLIGLIGLSVFRRRETA
ncbi:MAG: PEP-CTERM sorting domain-containing protein [Acidobacteriaceae bacterium]